ncbi:hypothetical protein OHA79_03570 [Streptomyces sp. NBC_00841]|uniref:hypothetical protein n=1 Tax=Streptomyces sp. NBC_00841 TaxID=2975847 RepID=UPI002DDB499E|nr:hypothetical protein [Streptomyces sp. NBC_00841]WRZ97083.1 hypothetical protein OHA79_03570 [Streptomyces sp. NBC_00841]
MRFVLITDNPGSAITEQADDVLHVGVSSALVFDPHGRDLPLHGPTGIASSRALRPSHDWRTSTTVQPSHRISERTHRLARLQPRPARTVRPWDPKRYAAVYPEIVTTMPLYAAPLWLHRTPAGRFTALPQPPS